MAVKWDVQKGHVNKHNADYGYVKGQKVVEESKWGWQKARERYGAPTSQDTKAPDQSQPQFKNDQRLGNKYDAPNDWVRGANEDATKMPGFDHGSRTRKK